MNQGGKKSKETSATFIRRPKQPLVIYEFQVRFVCSVLFDVLTCRRDNITHRHYYYRPHTYAPIPQSPETPTHPHTHSRTFTYKRRTHACMQTQGCPFCAKVREVVSILDLDVLFLPCPRGASLGLCLPTMGLM